MKVIPEVLAFFVLYVAPAYAALTVELDITPDGAQFAGTPAMLQASITQTGSEIVHYQFSYRRSGGVWRVLQDFHTPAQLDWAVLEQGAFELRVRARGSVSGETAEAVREYSVISHATVSPAVLPTINPLVALYSAPPCNAGLMVVRFRRQATQFWQYTQVKPCAAGVSLNFYVAGMRANTTYFVQQQVFTAPAPAPPVNGPELMFQTGIPAAPFNTVTMSQLSAGTSVADSMVLHSFYGGSGWFPVATDLSGAPVWYYPQPMTSVLRHIAGGTMMILVREDVTGRVIREVDLAGHLVRETNSTEVSRQLVAMGHDPIGVFHHEALRLANGHTLVLASVERILTDVQGPGPVNVYGEMVIDLDENLQAVWAWNAFETLDPYRMAILGETCTFEGPGCPALFLAPTATDWLHANSIAHVPEDGNLVVSLRHQDWVIKIDYQNGSGSGEVLWRLGEGGDFTLDETSPNAWPWFSHQHDAKLGGGALLLYDNGNTRVEGPGGIGGNSRGQVLLLDENARTARLVLNLDLGAYSAALGSAERLSNGNFYFDNGLLGDPTHPLSEGVELSTSGVVRYKITANGFVYRSFRLRDMYRP